MIFYFSCCFFFDIREGGFREFEKAGGGKGRAPERNEPAESRRNAGRETDELSCVPGFASAVIFG